MVKRTYCACMNGNKWQLSIHSTAVHRSNCRFDSTHELPFNVSPMCETENISLADFQDPSGGFSVWYKTDLKNIIYKPVLCHWPREELRGQCTPAVSTPDTNGCFSTESQTRVLYGKNRSYGWYNKKKCHIDRPTALVIV